MIDDNLCSGRLLRAFSLVVVLLQLDQRTMLPQTGGAM